MTAPAPTSARQRILDTAAGLFYGQGLRAVGVDTVVDEAGVAKATLYRHFPTKDDLIAAVIEADNADYWRQWDERAGSWSDPMEELTGHLTWIAAYTTRDTYRGCPFINVGIEFPDPAHPGRQVAVRHKQELRHRLAELCRRIGVHEPAVVADQLALLVDGAYVTGELLGRHGPAGQLTAAGVALVRAGADVSSR